MSPMVEGPVVIAALSLIQLSILDQFVVRLPRANLIRAKIAQVARLATAFEVRGLPGFGGAGLPVGVCLRRS